MFLPIRVCNSFLNTLMDWIDWISCGRALNWVHYQTKIWANYQAHCRYTKLARHFAPILNCVTTEKERTE